MTNELAYYSRYLMGDKRCLGQVFNFKLSSFASCGCVCVKGMVCMHAATSNVETSRSYSLLR